MKRNNKVIALQISINSVMLLNINNEKDLLIVLTKQSKQNALISILHFDFCYSSPNFDFFIVETAGIRFYKIDDDKLSCKEVKFFGISINFCWFEVILSI